MDIETATFKAYNREQESKHIFYVKNAHGDVIGKIDEQGNLLNSYAYNAFGELVTSADFTPEQSQNITRFLYAGEQYDETSGLYYLRARNYDAGAGRFTQEDTYLGDGRNLYAYVHSNPLKYVDPSGHASLEQYDEIPDEMQVNDVCSGGGTFVIYNGTQVPVYRGGNDFTARPCDVRIAAGTGYVDMRYGVSVNVDPNAVSNYGGAYKVVTVPNELKIIQRGSNAGHFEIVPANGTMGLNEYQGYFKQIKSIGPY